MSISRFCSELSALVAIFATIYIWSVIGSALQS
ncbi:hypothetical protein SAMN05421779_101365 [Insolitispirillum peregrinum]|uniref:Uncharacterized protein n=1 Tax=Insolitispirillum peregrinum TaxID=80876 RepID=A0A1N7IMM4_9PROT|nr:hypothetical protein SAMN05421779_101365 [Insolitispirillum peregrinum]